MYKRRGEGGNIGEEWDNVQKKKKKKDYVGKREEKRYNCTLMQYFYL